MNYFNGTKEDFLHWIGKPGSEKPVTIADELSLNEKVFKLWEAHPELHL